MQANKQYFLGRTNTLSIDIDNQDRQEENLNRQINDFNLLVRDKESYIKSLLNELNGVKEQKEQYTSELTVLQHKEDFLVNELIFKEEQLNDVIMNNEEMRRKINSGNSQSKFLQAENERLRKEMSQYKEEGAVTRATSDYLNSELNQLKSQLSELEHKLVLGQNSIESLQRENAKDKAELSHANSTVEAQMKAYEELKSQLQLINERNHKMQMMNEVMRMKQTQQ